MTNRMRETVTDFLTKRWDPVFYKRRQFQERGTFLEITLTDTESNDDFRVFWLESPEHMPYLQKIKELCDGVTLKNLQQGTGGSGNQGSAWLEDREYIPDESTGWLRMYSNTSSRTPRLTAASLYEHLSQKVRRFRPLCLEY